MAIDIAVLLQIRASAYAPALTDALYKHGEGFQDLQDIISAPPGVLCSNGKYYRELVVGTHKWFYICRDNAGDGIHVSTCVNPEVYLPTDIPDGFETVSVISSDCPYRLVRTTKEGFTMAEQQGYKRLVPLYRQSDGEIPTLIGTAWVHYNSNDSVVDKKRRLESIELLGLKIDDKDTDYDFWQGILDKAGKTVGKASIPETILDGLHWS